MNSRALNRVHVQVDAGQVLVVEQAHGQDTDLRISLPEGDIRAPVDIGHTLGLASGQHGRAYQQVQQEPGLAHLGSKVGFICFRTGSIFILKT